MKSLNKYSLTQKISAFSVIILLMFSFAFILQSDSRIENITSSVLDKDIQSLSFSKAQNISKQVLVKTTLINVIKSNLKRVRNAEDASLFLESWMDSSNDLYEYSQYKRTGERNLKRQFTYFSKRFFKIVPAKEGVVFRKNATGLLDFLSSFNNDEFQYRFLNDDGNNLRFLILYHQANTEIFHLFKFSFTYFFKNIGNNKFVLVDKDANVVFPSSNLEDRHKNKFLQEIPGLPYQVYGLRENKVSNDLFFGLTQNILFLALIFSSIALLLVIFIFFPYDREKRKILSQLTQGEFEHLNGPHIDKHLTPLLSTLNQHLANNKTHIEKQSDNISDLTKHNVNKDQKNKELAQVIHMIFSSLELGFFIFDRDGNITDLHNRYFKEMIKKPIDTLNITQLFGDNAETWIRNLFKGDTSFSDMNLIAPINLNSKLLRNDKEYKIQYYPLYDHNGHLNQVICVLEDISEETMLTDNLNNGQETLEIIAAVNNSKYLYQDLIKNLEQIQRDVQKYNLDFKDDNEFLSISKTIITSLTPYFDYFNHTNANSIIEDFLNRSSGIKRDKFIEETNNLFESLFLDINSYSPLTGVAPFSEEEFIFSTDKSHISENDLFKINTVNYFQNFEFLFRHQLETAKKKCAKFEILDEVKEFDYSRIKKFMFLLNEVYSNIVVHATLPPEVRDANNKKDGISVTTKISQENDRIIFEISDDGIGINPQDIRDRIKELGSDEYTLNKNDEDVLQEIFKDKISSQNDNGYGLSLLRREINILNGRYRVESEIKTGTTIILEVPVS